MASQVSKSRLCLSHGAQTFLLTATVPNSLTSSGSFMLSLAEFLATTAHLYPQSLMATQEKGPQPHKSSS
jgi:hypothetical protein